MLTALETACMSCNGVRLISVCLETGTGSFEVEIAVQTVTWLRLFVISQL